jgi:hypothetical protein
MGHLSDRLAPNSVWAQALNRPLSGPERMAAEDTRLGPMQQAMLGQGNDPLRDFYSVLLNERGADGERPLGPSALEQMQTLNEMTPYDPAADNAMANLGPAAEYFMNSGMGPGFGAMATIGKAGGVAEALADAARVADDLPGIGHNLGPSMVPPAKGEWGLSDKNLRVLEDDMSRTVEASEVMSPRPIVSPEDIPLGTVYLPAVGDKSAAGMNLLAINDTPLAWPVHLPGGAEFPFTQAGRPVEAGGNNSVWASGKSVISDIDKNIIQAAQDFNTDNINLAYTAGGGRNADFSVQMSDALLAQMQNAPVTQATIRRFDSEIRNITEDWPGVMSPDAASFLASSAGTSVRKPFVELMAGTGTSVNPGYQRLGFPDVPSTRYAISNPTLLSAPEGSSGYMMARGDVGGGIVDNPAVPHPSYNTQLRGFDPVGLEGAGVPRELFWRDFLAARREKGALPGDDRRSMELNKSIRQVVDQEWIDSLMEWQRNQRRGF